jgi:transcriptional regulator with XRE-family HTH domain
MMTLGERVVMWRKRRKMTQKELASKIALHPISLSKIERGVVEQVEADTIKKLAQALRVKTDYLHGLVPDEEAEATYASPPPVPTRQRHSAKAVKS